MNRREYSEAKRRLERVRRELETELLTPEQQNALEQRAATLERSLHRGGMRSRAMAALVGAVFGAALAVLYDVFGAAPHASSAPETAWASIDVWLWVPWALFGALVGAMLGRGGGDAR